MKKYLEHSTNFLCQFLSHTFTTYMLKQACVALENMTMRIIWSTIDLGSGGKNDMGIYNDRTRIFLINTAQWNSVREDVQTQPLYL